MHDRALCPESISRDDGDPVSYSQGNVVSVDGGYVYGVVAAGLSLFPPLLARGRWKAQLQHGGSVIVAAFTVVLIHLAVLLIYVGYYRAGPSTAETAGHMYPLTVPVLLIDDQRVVIGGELAG